MPIPTTTLRRWSQHYSKDAPKRTHESVRHALNAYKDWSKGNKCEKVLLQGSYKNYTNLRHASVVDIVVTLPEDLHSHVAKLSGNQLAQDTVHRVAYGR